MHCQSKAWGLCGFVPLCCLQVQIRSVVWYCSQKLGLFWFHSFGFTHRPGWWHVGTPYQCHTSPVVWCWGCSGSLLQAGGWGQVCSISITRGMLSSAHTYPQCDFRKEEWIQALPLHGILGYLLYPPSWNLKICFRFPNFCKEVLLAFKMPSRLSILIH